MKNIGLAYTKSQINQLLTNKQGRRNRRDSLIGLIFAAGNDFPEELEIRQVYFDPGTNTRPVSFYSIKKNTTKEKLYREDQNGDKLEPTNISYSSTNDQIEFANKLNFGFGFFSCEELDILITLSNRIIIFGGTINPGMMTFPDPDITFPNPPFATLFAEIDRDDMNNIPINLGLPSISLNGQQVIEEELPTIAIAMPCPPYWDPAEKLVSLYSSLRRKRARVVSKKERWPKIVWMNEIKKAWFIFTLKLDEDLNRSKGKGKGRGTRINKLGDKKVDYKKNNVKKVKV